MAKSGKTAKPSTPVIRSLDEIEPEFGTPPAAVVVFILAATLAAAGFFISKGFAARTEGGRELAAQLLKVQPRNDAPTHFELESMDGSRVSIDQFKGKIVFLNFWATWCPPCVEEMPSMERLHQKMRDDPNFAMVAISVDKQWDEVRKFFKDYQPDFTILLDPEGGISKQYGTTQFPETYVIIDGRVRGFIEGPRDWDTWFAEAYLKDLLAAKRGSAPVASR